MKRYFFAVAMLAVGAGGVMWLAIKERPAPALAPAVPSPSTSVQPKPAGPSADAGQAFPPLAAGAAWSLVRWDMSPAKVEVVFEEAGFTVVDATDPKTGVKRLRVKSSPWEATIDFEVRSPTQIVVTADNVSKEGGDGVVTRMKERAPVTVTTELTEWRWKKETGEATTLSVNVAAATATMKEVHVREAAPGGEVGFAGLRWGMSTQEVVGQLTSEKYVARVAKAVAEGSEETVPFKNGDVEGKAAFNQFGLRRVELSGKAADPSARAKELESSLGKPASTEVSTKTEHVDDARMTSIELEVSRKEPGDGCRIVETYRPKK